MEILSLLPIPLLLFSVLMGVGGILNIFAGKYILALFRLCAVAGLFALYSYLKPMILAAMSANQFPPLYVSLAPYLCLIVGEVGGRLVEDNRVQRSNLRVREVGKEDLPG